MKALILFLIFPLLNSNAQTVKLLTAGAKTSLRGLSVVSEKIIWASGSNGVVARSADGGDSWEWLTVKNFEKADFRDIEAFDSSTAIIIAVGEPAYILKTADAGKSWRVVYENVTKGMFLDAMDFKNSRKGTVAGDPIGKRFFIAHSRDHGNSWVQIETRKLPVADSGEACFAASGTNIKMLKNGKLLLVSGGSRSRLFMGNRGVDIPILQGRATTGANSIALKNRKTLIVTGGDFNTPDSSFENCIVSTDRGKTWRLPITAPHGYRSCVEYINGTKWISCGLNGIDYSTDDGRTWQWISREGFHVCKKARKGNSVFLAGGNGKIGKLVTR